MWIGGHLQVGWFAGWLAGLKPHDRALVAWCGVLPDLDAVTRLGGVETYLAGHHVYLHNLLACGLLPVVPALLASRKWAVYPLGLVAVGLHLLSDGFGLLELRPLWPLARTLWWPNGARWLPAFIAELIVPAVLIALQVWLYRRRRVSVLEVIPEPVAGWWRRSRESAHR